MVHEESAVYAAWVIFLFFSCYKALYDGDGYIMELFVCRLYILVFFLDVIISSRTCMSGWLVVSVGYLGCVIPFAVLFCVSRMDASYRRLWRSTFATSLFLVFYSDTYRLTNNMMLFTASAACIALLGGRRNLTVLFLFVNIATLNYLGTVPMSTVVIDPAMDFASLVINSLGGLIWTVTNRRPM